MLKLTNISYQINNRQLINNLSFSLETQKHLLILGPSGCGKSTLLSILGGLNKPDQGQVIYDNRNIYNLDESQRDKFRGQNISILFQNFHLIKVLSIKENLALAQNLSGLTINYNQINDILKRLNLFDKSDQKINNLSNGEAQRLAVARAVITNPKWILCDEPTSALDDNNCQIMLNLLEEEAKRCQASLIIVTHDKRVTNHFDQEHILKLV